MKNHELILCSETSTQRQAPGFSMAARLAMTRALSGYPLFIPFILWTWFAVEIIVPVLGYKSSIGLLLLFPTGLVGYAAAAAKSAGRLDAGIMRLYLTRFSAVMDYFWLYAYFLVCGLALTIALSFFGDINNGGFISRMSPLYAALFIVMCMRLWPMVSVPFLYAGHSQWLITAGTQLWKGPGMGRAWVLTRRRDTFYRTTLPLFTIGGFIFGGYLMLRPSIGSSGLALFTFNSVFYGIALPLFVSLVDVLAEQLENNSGITAGLKAHRRYRPFDE